MIKTLLTAALLVSMAGAAATERKRLDTFEDTFCLYALDAQMHHQYHRASAFFAELHHQTSKKEYLYQSIRMLEYANDIDALGKSVRQSLAKSPNDPMLKRFEVIVLLKEGKYAEASQKAVGLNDGEKKAPDYMLYAEARLKLGDYAGTVAALKQAYALNFEDSTAERIALIQYAHLGEKEEAVKFLKAHIGTHGNSALIGKRLGSFYADQGDLSEAAAMYEQIYEGFDDLSAAEEAAKIYLYQKEFSKLTALLEKSGMNDPMLLDLYVRVKAFDKASKLSRTLYEREDNPLYLAQSAVYSYEGSTDRNDPALLESVVEGLKKASEDIEEPLYLNYLGYLMIDHDIDVKEGMQYVQRALEKQPDSPYYIDSMAWGKYKLGECEEAMTLIKKVEAMVGDTEEEVNQHLKAIKTCKTKEKH